MTFDGLMLPIGVVCLGVPTALICGRRMRETLSHPIRRQNDGLVSLLRSPLNWLDLARAAGGTWLVLQALKGVVGAGEELAITFLSLELAIFLAGIFAQTLWIRRPFRVIGPIFFLTGMTLVLSGLSAVFALVAAFACALMFKRVSSVFVLVPVGLLAFGYLFNELSPILVFNAAVFGLPPIMAFRLGTRMSFLRRSTAPHPAAPAPAVEVKAAAFPPPDHQTSALPNGAVKAPARTVETPPEVAPVIRPNFVRPIKDDAFPTLPKPRRDPQPRKEPVVNRPPEAAVRSGALPDFLRLADEPAPESSKGKKRLFARKGA